MNRKNDRVTGLVSVVMPAFNAERYIRKSVQSVLSQTYSNLELIVVNDGSYDSTLSIIESLKKQDSRIRIFNQNNSGIPASPRNLALKEARGTYICFLDADDFYEPEKIEKQLAIFSSHRNVDICFHDLHIVDDRGLREQKTYLSNVNFLTRAKPYLRRLNEELWLCNGEFYEFMSTEITAVTIQGIMIKKTAFQSSEFYFNEELKVGEDIDLWFRLALKGNLLYLNEALCSYRRHSTNLTSNVIEFLPGSITAHEMNLARGKNIFSTKGRRKYCDKIARLYGELAYHYYLERNSIAARNMLLRSYKRSFSFATLYLYFRSFFPPPEI